MKRKNNKGFSLIELIIAIAILVILTGLLAPQFMRYMEKSREAKDMQALDTVYGAVQVALANEKAYDELAATVTTGTLLEALTTKGAALSAIEDDAAKAADAGALPNFSKEVMLTFGAANNSWASKAVIKANGTDSGSAVFVHVDPTTMKVTTWIGKTAEKSGKPDKDKEVLNPTTEVAGAKTAGTVFYITK